MREKSDHSLAARIPKVIADMIQLEKDQTVSIEAKDGRIIITPVTSRVRGHGFEVALTGEKISGVVLCHQIETIDFVERGLTFVEKAPTSTVSEALAKVRAIVME